jgi:imidazolonepropionase-like amidohydrolase
MRSRISSVILGFASLWLAGEAWAVNGLPTASGRAGSAIVFVGVNVVDVRHGAVVPDQSVLVEAGRITQIAPRRKLRPPRDSIVIDAKGRYLMPGLMDMHAHVYSPEDLVLYLANGVTTIRSMWGHASTLQLRDSVARGDTPGPTLFVAGQIVDGKPAIQYPTLPLGDPAEVEAVVARQAADGYDLVKIYSNMSLEVFDAVIAAGGRHGIEVSGHLPRQVSAPHAIAAGMGTMEHFLEVVGSLLHGPAIPSLDLALLFRNTSGARAVAEAGEKGTNLVAEVDEQKLAEIARLFAASETRVVPTLVAMRNFTTAPNTANPAWDRYLTPSVRRTWQNGWRQRAENWPIELRRGEDAVYRLRLHVLAALHRAGAKIMVGTDAPVPGVYMGLSVIDEVMTMPNIGMTNAAALRAATLVPGEYLRRMPRGGGTVRGEIAVGAAADLLLLQSNPLQDLAALRGAVGVMQAGRWYPAVELRTMLEQNAERYAEWEGRFDGAPIPVDEVAAAAATGGRPNSDYGDARGSTLARGTGIADFIGPDGWAARVWTAAGEGAATIHAALRDSSGQWQRWQATLRTNGWALRDTEGRETHVERADAGWLLRSAGSERRLSTSTAPVVVLTGTPADMLLLNVIGAQLQSGETREVVAWRCDARLRCATDQIMTATLSSTGFEIVRVGTGFAGTRGYIMREHGRPLGNDAETLRLWVGDGPIYGGEPFRMEGAGVSSWARMR